MKDACSWSMMADGVLCASGTQKFQDDPHVVYARSIVEEGAKVVCVEDGLPTWVAEVSPQAIS